MYDLLIKNGRIWYQGEFKQRNIYINDDRFELITQKDFEAKEVIDAKDGLVLPGLIDPHVHFDLDLGHIHSKDDFYHGSKQAAYGGKSVYIDFLDPVDHFNDLEAAYIQRKKQVDVSYTDYLFHATIKNPQCDLELFVKKMLSLNIYSLKCFTTYSESGRRTNDNDIIELLKLSKKYRFLLLVHIEDDQLILRDVNASYQDLLKSRPSLAEYRQTLKLAQYVRDYGGYLYMVHLSSGKTLDMLVNQFGDILNQNFFVESCPHYFLFNHQFVNGRKGFLYTMAPPLRTKEEQLILRELFPYVFSIGTDHCAFNRIDKNQYFLKDTPLGIGGIEHSFDVLYALFGPAIIPKMSSHIVGLFPQLKGYGEIKEGYFANLIIYQEGHHQITHHHGKTDYDLYRDMDKLTDLTHHLIRGSWVIKDRELLNPQGREVTYVRH